MCSTKQYKSANNNRYDCREHGAPAIVPNQFRLETTQREVDENKKIIVGFQLRVSKASIYNEEMSESEN